MTFQVPASKASIKQNRFEFELPNEYDGDGNPIAESGVETFSLPKMQYINADVRQRLVSITIPLKDLIDAGGKPSPENVAELLEIQRELFERYAPGLYAKLGDDQMLAVLNAWQAASSVTVGESSPSAD